MHNITYHGTSNANRGMALNDMFPVMMFERIMSVWVGKSETLVTGHGWGPKVNFSYFYFFVSSTNKKLAAEMKWVVKKLPIFSYSSTTTINKDTKIHKEYKKKEEEY